MAAGEFNILADQGANYVLYFLYETNGGVAIDLSAYTGRMQIRRSALSTDILIGSTGDPVSGTLRGGGTTGSYSGTTGGVYISYDASTMQNCPSGRHVYDCELIAGNVVTRAIRGRFEVIPEVTR